MLRIAFRGHIYVFDPDLYQKINAALESLLQEDEAFLCITSETSGFGRVCAAAACQAKERYPHKDICIQYATRAEWPVNRYERYFDGTLRPDDLPGSPIQRPAGICWRQRNQWETRLLLESDVLFGYAYQDLDIRLYRLLARAEGTNIRIFRFESQSVYEKIQTLKQEALSEREKFVLQSVHAGNSYGWIAQQIGVSTSRARAIDQTARRRLSRLLPCCDHTVLPFTPFNEDTWSCRDYKSYAVGILSGLIRELEGYVPGLVEEAACRVYPDYRELQQALGRRVHIFSYYQRIADRLGQIPFPPAAQPLLEQILLALHGLIHGTVGKIRLTADYNAGYRDALWFFREQNHRQPCNAGRDIV